MKNKKKTESKQEERKEPTPQELKDLLLRTQANFENYRKQSEKRISDMREMAAKGIILQLLPVIDNFDLALKSNSADNGKEFRDGMMLIHKQLNTLLESNGIKTIETQGKVFDAHLHEPLMKVESDKPENTIIEEFQRGFTMNDVVIRHAKVKVSAGMKKNDDENNNQEE